MFIESAAQILLTVNPGVGAADGRDGGAARNDKLTSLHEIESVPLPS